MSQLQSGASEFSGYVAALLRRWCLCERVSQGEETKLVNVARVFAKRDCRGYTLSRGVAGEDTGVDQLLIRCVGGLFIGKGPDSPLGIALEDYLDSGDATLLARFERVVANRARQELYQLWKKLDPLRAKFREILTTFAHHDNRVKATPAQHPDWNGVASLTDPRTDRERASPELITAILREELPRVGRRLDAVVAALDRIAQDTTRCGMVWFNDLIEALCLAELKPDVMEDEQSRAQWSIDPQLRIALDRATTAAMDAVRRITDRYVKQNKIEEVVSDAFLGAISDLLAEYCTDFRRFGDLEGHLRARWPESVEFGYSGAVKHRFEHLQHVAWEAFAETMRRHFQ